MLCSAHFVNEHNSKCHKVKFSHIIFISRDFAAPKWGCFCGVRALCGLNRVLCVLCLLKYVYYFVKPCSHTVDHRTSKMPNAAPPTALWKNKCFNGFYICEGLNAHTHTHAGFFISFTSSFGCFSLPSPPQPSSPPTFLMFRL